MAAARGRGQPRHKQRRDAARHGADFRGSGVSGAHHVADLDGGGDAQRRARRGAAARGCTGGAVQLRRGGGARGAGQLRSRHGGGVCGGKGGNGCAADVAPRSASHNRPARGAVLYRQPSVSGNLLSWADVALAAAAPLQRACGAAACVVDSPACQALEGPAVHVAAFAAPLRAVPSARAARSAAPSVWALAPRRARCGCARLT